MSKEKNEGLSKVAWGKVRRGGKEPSLSRWGESEKRWKRTFSFSLGGK
jgi:hypothetical protein